MRGFQLAFSLRNLSLNDGGELPKIHSNYFDIYDHICLLISSYFLIGQKLVSHLATR